MAGSQTNTKRKTTATGKPAKKPVGRPKKQDTKRNVPEEHTFLRAEVLIICSFAVSVLLFLSNFKLCGVAGAFLRSLQLGVFGTIGFLAPVLLFVGTCFYMSNKGSFRATIKIAAVIMTLLALCSFCQLLFGEPYLAGRKITEYYTASAQSGIGGGLIGGLLSAILCSLFGTVGAYLVLCVALVISVICITEKSLVSVLKTGGGKAYQYAREDMGRRKEIYAERQEERRRLREEQKVRGVNLDSTNLLRELPDEPEELTDEFLDEFPDEVFDEPEDSIISEPVMASIEAEAKAAVRASITPPPVPSRPSADIFTGNITMPADDFVDEDDDTVPFDEFDSFGNLPESLVSAGIHDMDDAEEIFASRESRTLEEIEVVEVVEAAERQPEFQGDTFVIPEGPKRVETASGKIIETETELLQKKLENRRAEVAASAQTQEQRPSGNVRQQISEPYSSADTVARQIQEKESPVKKEYIFPNLELLKKGAKKTAGSDKEYRETAIKLQQTLQNFGVGVTVTNISCGPSVTRYELHPEQGVKVSKIVGLTDDIKLSLAAADIRIEAPIPGKSAVGIEVPNKENNMVFLRDLLESDEFQKHPSSLAFAVGKDIGGQTVVADIAKMPHLLIAGATGSGKSVCINTLIMSIIYKANPDDVKMIMVDPKVVELSVYNGIPHLLIPVVTDPKKASGALNWAVAEMTDRYKKFAEYNVRDLKGYNQKVEAIKGIEDENKPQKLPQIVIIVDELADLMMVSPGEVEDSICRLAQLARAAGIHLVIATQRPSVNVITGLIKANVPSRIAFSVSSGVDSRTIIDMNGAEKLLGKGDMLFYPAGYQKPQRVQGAFVSDPEVSKVVEFLNEQGMTAEYQPDIESQIAAPAAAEAAASGPSDGRDAYFLQAAKFIIEKDKASIGMLQRVFKIGFNRAARIMDQLAEAGVVGEEEGTKPRKVLMTMEEFQEQIEGGNS